MEADRISPAPVTCAYYIYAPRYVATSAGIRGLYSLASSLREAGQKAWIVTYIDHVQDQLPPECEDLVLTYEMAMQHQKLRLSPVVVYSETVDGNPLRARAIVRYIMNVPGLLGGPKTYAPEECLYAFSETLADEIGKPDWSLFIPLVDETRFKPGRKAKTLTCVYASKYKAVHKGVLGALPADTVEISRDLHHSQDPGTLLSLLQRSKRLYLYENTALAIEAALCDCVVVFLPNPYLGLSIGAKDHSDNGMAWGDSPAEIARAEATLPHFRAAYMACKARYPNRLRLFITRTTAYRAGINGYGVDWAAIKPPGYSQLASDATDRFIASHGFAALLPKVFKVIATKGPFTAVAIFLTFVRRRLGL